MPSQSFGDVFDQLYGGYTDGNTAEGVRMTLADEFHDVYVYNLRGNQRTAGEQSRREGGKVFDSGSSRSPVNIWASDSFFRSSAR